METGYACIELIEGYCKSYLPFEFTPVADSSAIRASSSELGFADLSGAFGVGFLTFISIVGMAYGIRTIITVMSSLGNE